LHLLCSRHPPAHLICFFSDLSGTCVFISSSSSPRFGFPKEFHSCAQQQLPFSSGHVCEIHLIGVDVTARPWLPPSPSLLPTFRCSRLGAATTTQPSGPVLLFQGRGQGCVPQPSGSAVCRRYRQSSLHCREGQLKSAGPMPPLKNSLLSSYLLDPRPLKEHQRLGFINGVIMGS
jgi:hypothetical protein